MTKDYYHYRPRLTVELEDEKDFLALQRLVPHGMQKPLFNVLVKEVIAVLEKGGERALAALIDASRLGIRPREVLPTLRRAAGKKVPDGND